MGFFGSIFKAVARGSKNLLKGAARGIKATAEKAARGVKSGFQKVKGFITGKQKPKPWKEGDPAGFRKDGIINVGGGNTMRVVKGRPTGKVIRGSPYTDPAKTKGLGSQTFKNIDIDDLGL